MFIVFEGIEGAGKTSLISAKALQELFRSVGLEPLLTREPGDNSLGPAIRSLLLNSSGPALESRAELFLLMADRAQHVREVIEPAIASGRPVICDRFSLSTLAYQGYGRGLDLDILRVLCDFASAGRRPDLTIVLDLPVPVGLARAQRRNREKGQTITEGRFEALDLEFHERVRAGYLELAGRSLQDHVIISALDEPEVVLANCLAEIKRRLLGPFFPG